TDSLHLSFQTAMGNTTSFANRQEVPDKWDASFMTSQKGKLAVVTGANSGIGYEAALELARKGAHVVLACRSEAKGREAEANIRELIASTAGAGTVEYMQLDVSDLSSVKTFAEEFKQTHDRLDVLINNAGVLGGPYTLSVDGYERQFATNHLGPFALTAQLFDVLKQSAPSRVVNVSSALARQVKSFDEDEMMPTEKTYSQFQAYKTTKLCNLLFTMELSRRMEAGEVKGVAVVACHPGLTTTNLEVAPAASSNWFWTTLYKVSGLIPRQNAQMGALPTLYAATGSDVKSSDYFGPKHFGTFGHPVREDPSELSKSEVSATQLWALSEKLVHLSFGIKQ
ncbi:hypothetical protein BBJ28_00014600, partial [Nothophytophthora sp. Chile5]